MSSQVKQKVDFGGHDIYVGIDVHKKTWGVSILTKELEHKTFIQPSKPKVLGDYLHRNFPNGNYFSAYEAGFSGFWIDRELKLMGIKNIVVNPLDIPTTDKERKNKTDKRDARKIARMLRSQSLEQLYIPQEDVLEDRMLLRSRQQLLRDIKRYKCRIKSGLNFFGIQIPEIMDKPYWSKSFRSWLRDNHFKGYGHNVITIQLDQLEYIESRKKDLDRHIVELSKTSKYSQLVNLLKSIPGVGLLGSMILISEIIDINRFKRADELHSFAGLIPGVHSSGDHEHVGRITSRANHFIRPIIVQCAWIASKRDPELMLTYINLKKKMKSNRAIIRVAKKLLNRVRYVWINGKQLNKDL